MKQYLDLLENILQNGVEKESGRANMPNTIGISNAVIKMDLKDGFPLLTTKKMFLNGVIHELLWILKGNTNIKYLVDNKVNIWNGDAYRWYQTKIVPVGAPELTMDEFIEKVNDGIVYEYNEDITVTTGFARIENHKYVYGDLGKVYGYQWRNQNGIDQIKDIIYGLKNNPYSRYHIIDGWNKADFSEMALPPCHLLYQFVVRPLSNSERNKEYLHTCGYLPYGSEEEQIEKINDPLVNIPKFYLDLNMYQRSCDSGCGIPFNLASMSLLLKIIAQVSNMIPGVATWIGGDTHLYVDHISTAKEQIKREPYELPELYINKQLDSLDDILELTIGDFNLINYKYYPSIKYELFAGVKK